MFLSQSTSVTPSPPGGHGMVPSATRHLQHYAYTALWTRMTEQFFRFVPGDLDLWPWHSNSFEQGTKHLPYELVQIRSAIRKILYAQTRMWANAQHDGRPAEYRWRPLFNTTKFGWRPLPECSNAAKKRNPLKFARGAPNSQTDLSR